MNWIFFLLTFMNPRVIREWDQQTNFGLALQILTHELISAGHIKWMMDLCQKGMKDFARGRGRRGRRCLLLFCSLLASFVKTGQKHFNSLFSKQIVFFCYPLRSPSTSGLTPLMPSSKPSQCRAALRCLLAPRAQPQSSSTQVCTTFAFPLPARRCHLCHWLPKAQLTASQHIEAGNKSWAVVTTDSKITSSRELVPLYSQLSWEFFRGCSYCPALYAKPELLMLICWHRKLPLQTTDSMTFFSYR